MISPGTDDSGNKQTQNEKSFFGFRKEMLVSGKIVDTDNNGNADNKTVKMHYDIIWLHGKNINRRKVDLS